MKCTLTFFFLLFLSFTGNTQLNKSTWLVGGTGSFYSTENTYSSSIATYTSDVVRISISPSVGYLLLEKFAVGIRPSYTKTKAQVTTASGINTNENRLDIGPFTRYYFLTANKEFNILTDVSYQYGFYWFTPTKGKRHTFSASAGTVVFFNSSVGLELLIGYTTQTESINDTFKTKNEQKGLQMSIGFQIHLEN